MLRLRGNTICSRIVPISFIANGMRFGMSDLRERALLAVDEAADQAAHGPVHRSLALRFALAFLANFAEDRWPFDNFWRAIALRDEKVRCATALAAKNAIRRAVGGSD